MSERVHLVSLGCPKNRVDSEVMIGKIRGADCTLVDSPDEADVIVVNTCSFIQPATEESIDTVLEMAGYKEAGSCEKLIVTGCMVQRFGNALEDELPEVDHFRARRVPPDRRSPALERFSRSEDAWMCRCISTTSSHLVRIRGRDTRLG